MNLQILVSIPHNLGVLIEDRHKKDPLLWSREIKKTKYDLLVFFNTLYVASGWYKMYVKHKVPPQYKINLNITKLPPVKWV